MLTGAFLTQVRDTLRDDNANRWSTATIIRSGDQQLMGLVRTMMHGNREWSNHTMVLQSTEAAQPLKYCYEWRLPSWVMGVVGVWLKDGAATSETSSSPYRWTPAGAVGYGQEILKRGATNAQQFWEWSGGYSLRVYGLSSATDIVIQVVKRPSRMARIKLATPSTSTSMLYIPAGMEIGEVDLEEGVYINTAFQCVSTFAANGLNYGEVRRCIFSDPNEIVSAVRTYTAYFESAWAETLVAGDTLEALVNIPDEHCRYLVLLTARACMQQLNAAGIDAIKAELAEEAAKFMTYAAASRDQRGAIRFKKRGGAAGRIFDRERPDTYWGW